MFIEIIRPFEELHTTPPDHSRAHLNGAAYNGSGCSARGWAVWRQWLGGGGDPGTRQVRIDEVGAGRTSRLWAWRVCYTTYWKQTDPLPELCKLRPWSHSAKSRSVCAVVFFSKKSHTDTQTLTQVPCERGEERLCFLGEEIKNHFPLLTPKRSWQIGDSWSLHL